MNYDNTNPSNLVRNILKKVKFLRTKQLIICLTNSFSEYDESSALYILVSMQMKGYILLSKDGWAMTIGVYNQISDDKFYDKIDTTQYHAINFNIEPYLEKYDKSLVNLMWLVADTYPQSEDFVMGDYPFVINYSLDPNGKNHKILYQLAYFSKENELFDIQLLKSTKYIYPEFRDAVVRIAVVEDEKRANFVPRVGFKYICVLDNSQNNNFRILQKRSDEERWNDYEKPSN